MCLRFFVALGENIPLAPFADAQGLTLKGEFLREIRSDQS